MGSGRPVIGCELDRALSDVPCEGNVIRVVPRILYVVPEVMMPQGFFKGRNRGMDKVIFSECTLQRTDDRFALSFREKLELCKQIDRLELSSVELQAIQRVKADSLLIKSVCSALKNTTVIVPVQLNAESVKTTWNALKGGRSVRLQVRVPVSSVQMEYLLHMKPKTLISAVERTLQDCMACTDQVEFVAEDATRADPAFLYQLTEAVIRCGVRTLTFQDAAGAVLPEEVTAFFTALREAVPALEQVTLGYAGKNTLSLSDACAIAAIRGGVRLIKGSMIAGDQICLAHVARVLEAKGAEFGVFIRMNTPQLNRIASQMEAICGAAAPAAVLSQRETGDTDTRFTAHDTQDAIQAATVRLGYSLSQEDMDKIWSLFQTIAARKGSVTLHELDALIAAEAMQVPAAYTDVRFMVSTGTLLGAMAHMKIRYHDQELESTSAGDGVIDAAFLAIEQAIGRHFELDDFQIQTIAEGREAMGEALVKLRSDGKLFSGRSVSTDIVGASIMAYISALNKIVYEEEEA